MDLIYGDIAVHIDLLSIVLVCAVVVYCRTLTFITWRTRRG